MVMAGTSGADSAVAGPALLGLSALLLIVRLVVVMAHVRKQRLAALTSSFGVHSGTRPLRTMIVVGSGGHTKEMMQLVDALSPDAYQPRVYVVASTDKFSVDKIESVERQLQQRRAAADGAAGLGAPAATARPPPEQHRIVTVPRSREVRQSWASTCLSASRALAASFLLVARHRPDVVLCNGPGTCVPLCAAAFVYRLLLLLPRVRIVYVESVCRVRSLSLSGRMLYQFADLFFVQWPSLSDAYPLAAYIGRLL